MKQDALYKSVVFSHSSAIVGTIGKRLSVVGPKVVKGWLLTC